jgi:hypothetical protein
MQASAWTERVAQLAGCNSKKPVTMDHENGRLKTGLNHGIIKVEAAEILRSLIDRIVLMPAGRGADALKAEFHDHLVSILSFAARVSANNYSPVWLGQTVVGDCGNRQPALFASDSFQNPAHCRGWRLLTSILGHQPSQ